MQSKAKQMPRKCNTNANMLNTTSTQMQHICNTNAKQMQKECKADAAQRQTNATHIQHKCKVNLKNKIK